MTKEELKIVKKIVAEGYKLKAQHSNPDWCKALEDAEQLLISNKQVKSTTDFNTMTKDEAIQYCYQHEQQYKSDMYGIGEDGVEQFGCLIMILESDTIKPSELPSYGMDY